MIQPVGLFYSSSTGNSETVSRIIAASFNPVQVHRFDIFLLKDRQIPRYRNYIFGVPTWDGADLQDDWQEFLPRLAGTNLSKCKVALFGLGDQQLYPNSFVNSMGILYDWLCLHDAEIVGFRDIAEYRFIKSFATRNGKFVGLPIDEDRQPKLTVSRVKSWVTQLKSEFGYE